MIYDTIENLKNYPQFSNIAQFLKAHAHEILENGRYEIDERCYLAVSEYQTGDGNDFEAHERYIDFQYLASGEERINVQDLQKGKLTKAYDKEKDIAFYKVDAYESYVIDCNRFLVLDVNDLHQPCVKNGQAQTVKKYVFKIEKNSK